MLRAHTNVHSIDLSKWAVASADGDAQPIVVRTRGLAYCMAYPRFHPRTPSADS